ncbi:MAG TPA: glycosyltransferase [Bacteroidales bacterium]|nr:glycosyltransferase [Bacteroidales bacterium]
MKKVLIITYYWPPAGGSAVYRWLKFTKYLREFGWEPVIYTAENGEYPELDPANEKDIPQDITILKQPIWEPYSAYKKFIGQKKTDKVNVGFLSEKKKPALTERISVWVRGNFFIPDARKFWIKPSVKFLTQWLKDNPLDAIISSGPPHSMHLIAMGLKKKLNLPWIADFRDPWTKIDFYNELKLTWFANRKHHRLEKKVVTSADYIVAVGSQMQHEFEEIGARKAMTITNGYDTADKPNIPGGTDTKFTLAHFGTINKARNPEVLWKVLSTLTKENKAFADDLEIKFIGRIDQAVRDTIEKYELTPYLNKIDFLPHHEVLTMQRQSQVLLLLINNTHNAGGILTGKFFEYLASERPIIGIGPEEGDVASILNSAEAGKMVGFENAEKLRDTLLAYYELYKQGKLAISSSNIAPYSRYELTRKLSGILNEIAKK